MTPILRKLIQPTNTRARIYARDGTLIVDTARSLAQWTAHAQRADADSSEPPARRRTSGRADALFLQGAAARLPGDRHRQRHGLPGGARRPRGRGAAACCCSTGRASRSSPSRCRSAASTTCRACCCCRRAPARSTRSCSEERSVILILAAIALLASVVTSLLLARTVAGPMRRLSAAAEQRQPQHRRAHAAARVRRPHRRGRADGRRLPGDDRRALPAHRGEREVRRRRGARAEEPAHRRALDGRIAGLRQDRGGARISSCSRSRAS